jgi:hypothetical protein
MFRKILKVSEKVLLVVFFLSYVIHFILNIRISRLSEISDITEIIITISLGLYAVIASLKKLSYIVIFLLSATIFGVLTGLLTPWIFLNFSSGNLVMIIIIYLVVSFKSFFMIKSNGFLKWLLFVASLIISFHFFIIFVSIFLPAGLSEKGFNSFYTFVYLLYIITTLAMIFGLPNSNYPDWKKEHHQLFVRLILSVWLFIFVVSTLMLFIPFDRYKEKIFPEIRDKWKMEDYRLEKMPGLDKQI